MQDEGEKLEADTAERHATELTALDAGLANAVPADGSDAGAEALVAKNLYGMSVADDGKPEKKAKLGPCKMFLQHLSEEASLASRRWWPKSCMACRWRLAASRKRR